MVFTVVSGAQHGLVQLRLATLVLPSEGAVGAE